MRDLFDEIYGWFYHLDYSVILTAAVLLSILLLLFRKAGNRFIWGRVAESVLLLVWAGLVLVVTLFHRVPSAERLSPYWMPFHSYQGRFGGGGEYFRMNFLNVLLFYPGGALGASLLQRKRNAFWPFLYWILLCLFSVEIELAQYVFCLGQMDVDDLIHNAIGALLGVVVIYCGSYLMEKRKTV